MLIEFTLKNFRSFKDEATLCLDAEGLPSNQAKLIQTDQGMSLLPSVAIFGANASGKTNIFKAMAFMLEAMRNTDITKPTTEHQLLLPFKLNKISEEEPSLMQIVFWDSKLKIEYRYGFEIDKDRIVTEWLYIVSRVNTNFTKKLVFLRQKQAFEFGAESKLELEDLAPRVSSKFLALPIFAQLNHQISQDLLEFIKNIFIWDSNSFGLSNLAEAIAICNKDPQVLEKVNKLINKSDTGIQSIDLRSERMLLSNTPINVQKAFKEQNIDPKAYVTSLQAQTQHRMQDDDASKLQYFNFLDHESAGTLKLFVLSTFIMRALETGGIFVIDELDSSLHPLLVQAIIDYLEDPDINTKGVQLIYSSHDVHMLSRRVNLRRDQIWFVEKNKKEESSLVCLSEFKIRNDFDVAKNYLLGRFGGVPALHFKVGRPNVD